jgi:hypothetical protein
MPDLKCPFSMLLASGASHCRHAEEVVRRGGSEFDCREPTAHAACRALVPHLNATALPALGFEDDLSLTPKSVYERILAGGLQGLRMANDAADNGPETADIRAVVEAAQGRYATLDAIPAGEIIPAIEACSIRKRHRRRR